MAASRVASLLLLSLGAAWALEEAPETAAAFAGEDECAAAGAGGEGCGLSALQVRSARRSSCEPTETGAPCVDGLQGLAMSSGSWCRQGSVAPKLWAPDVNGSALQVKVLSYNLFWWNLFKMRGGNGNSAGKLIEANMETPFDVMGFQECEGGALVVGGMPQYQVIQGPHAICMAYNTKAWALLEKGTTEVAEDMGTRYYGVRGTMWVRLKSLESEKTLFFVNHHGPLSVNSGGQCGGEATAYNLMNIMAKHAQEGDLLVLVGDFNANAASLTIQTLWSNLVQAYAGTSFGGVDNIFTNADASDVVETKNMGSGGSDHDAIYATIRVGGPKILQKGVGASSKSAAAAEELTGVAKPGWEWMQFWCGRIEDSTQYAPDPKAWSQTVTGEGAADPEHCCRECQASDKCASWVWRAGSRECVMSGAAPISKTPMDGFVSGLAYTAAAAAAVESAKHAATHVM